MLPDPPLRDARVLLRPITPADVPAIVEACQDPEIPRMTEIPTPYTELEARSWIEGHAALQAAGQALDLAITVPGEERMVGAIGLSRMEPASAGAAEIGYWVAREARGRGLATSALTLLSDWAIDGLGLVQLELLILPVNLASRRVAERAGYRFVGRVRPDRVVGGRRQTLERWVRLAGPRTAP